MFSGIIQSQGKITSISKSDEFQSIEIQSSLKNYNIGSSICCSGICLTVTAINNDKFNADISLETLNKTNSKIWKKGTILNLEKSLSIGDEISGHFVFGHVDSTGILKELKMVGKSWFMKIEFPKYLKKYITPKGSISLNGISLTVNEVSSKNFNCMIIPHTYKNTDIKTYKLNQILNLEVDMLARYAHFSNKTK
jgi:riboflavin synthase